MKLVSVRVAAVFLISLIAVGLYHNLADQIARASYVENLWFVGLSSAFIVVLRADFAQYIRGYLGGIYFFLLACAASDFVSMAFAGKSPYHWLAMPTEVIGYYPGGPDAPWFVGIILWAVSVSLLCAAAILIGLSVSSIFRKRKYDDSALK